MDQCDRFVDCLNKNILPYINYDRLQQSYETEEKSYAKLVLYTLHEIARQIYGMHLSCHGELEFAVVPGVISSRETGKVCLALLGLDLNSSGEHCSTDYLTKYGVVSQGHVDSGEIRTFLKEHYGPYHYGYTLDIDGDIHVEPEALPQELQNMLKTFEKDAEARIDFLGCRQTDAEQEEELEL